MTGFTFGLVHAPLTPFVEERIDCDCYGKLIDFHIRNGADALALPMHAGESVSLTVEERMALLEFAIKRVASRVPVIAHVSEAGTAIAASLAAHAVKAGAAATIASVPYYWTPPQSMLIDHFATISDAGRLPMLVHNTPAEMAGVEFSTASILRLIERSPNFIGLIDSSLDWQYMIEAVQLAREANPDFQFVSGTEYMISASAIGADGMISSLSNICPAAVRRLYDLCRTERYAEAREGQAALAVLCRLFDGQGISGLKVAARLMGRDCGPPRPPLVALAGEQEKAVVAALSPLNGAEPQGWS